MRKLIKADLLRVLTKKRFWLVIIFYIIVAVGFTAGFTDDKMYSFYRTGTQTISMIGFLACISIFSVIYGDDFRSMAFIGIIGKGISREKYVAAKMIENAIVNLAVMAVFCTASILAGYGASATISSYELGIYIFNSLTMAVNNFITISLASIFLFATGKVPLSTFGLIIVCVTGSTLKNINFTVAWVVDNFYYTGILEQSFSSFALDAVLDSVLMLIVCFAVYTAVSYGAVMLIFRKKELSF